MMKRSARTALKFLIVLTTILGSPVLMAQSVTGKVYDAITHEALDGATVELIPGTGAVVTNSEGIYTLENLTPGRYTLKVHYTGYKEKIIPDIWIRNGKLVTQNVALNQSVTKLQEAVVRDKVNSIELGAIGITEEQINRFAATYYDPARVVVTSPDVAITNDQNNRVSVRGISPNYNIWRLHDVEIVNPNHLSNAGTFSDEAIATGGSVNIISAQMLGNSQFLYGAFESQYGNTVGGMFDMSMRDGNNSERQYTAQASLIGLDFSAEGPFSKNGRASYLMNYRYSFTGLLTNMGVDFGGESIGFQDLSLNVTLPLKGSASVNVFATGGLNFNNFDALKLEDSEIQKDRSDIYYDGRMGAAGATLKHKLGNGYAHHSFAISGSQNTRLQNYYDSTQTLLSNRSTDRSNQITSLHTRYINRVGRGRIDYGVMYNHYQYKGDSLTKSIVVNQWVLNPHVSVSYPILPRLELEAGLNFMLNNSEDNAVDPRFGISYSLLDRTKIYARGGYYSQLLNPYNYYFVYSPNAGEYLAWRNEYNFQQSMRATFGISQEWMNWNVNLEGFYYYYPDANIFDTTVYTSEAETRGVSFLANRNYANNWYLTAGGSIFNSTWNRDGEAYDNRYNTGFNMSISGGKEWDFNTTEKERALSVNARVMYQGGLKEPVYTESDVTAANPPTNVVTNNSDFFRLDLRIQWTWYKENHTSSIALDLQNATNNQNESYRYFDSFTGMLEPQYQLGLIPILTYRVEF